jgi:DNA-binding NtrC family response regulator
LRERRDDIPTLAGLILQKCLRPGDTLLTLADDAISALMAHDYPGNVRELRNILMAAAAGVDGTRIGRGDIERVIGSQPVFRVIAAPAATEGSSLSRDVPPAPEESLEEVERAHLRRLLASHDGNLSAVAAALGVSLRTVYRKLNRYELR